MPAVPVYTAQATSPRPRSPNYIPTGDLGLEQRRLGGSVSAIGTVADRFADVQAKIQNQSDAAELVLANGQYETAKENAHQNVSMDPEVIQNPSLYTQKFDEQLKEAVLGINDGLSNNRVKALFANHVNANYEKDLLQANAVGLKKQTAAVQAKTLVALNDYSNRAADKPPEMRDFIIKQGEALVDYAWKNGFYPDELAKQKIIEAFRKSTFEKNMKYLADKDPYSLRAMDNNGDFKEVDMDTRLKMRKRAEDNIEHELKQATSDFEGMRKSVDEDWQSRSLNGLLTAQEIQDAKDRKNPFVSPERAAHHESVQNRAETKEGSDQVDAIMARHHLTWPPSYARIQQTMKELDDLATTSGVKNKAISQAAKDLQAETTSLRNANTAEVAAGMKYGKNYLEQNKPATPPVMSKFTGEKQLEDKELAELNTWIMQNPGRSQKDIEAKGKEILDRRKIKRDTMPKEKQNIQDLRR